MLNLLKERKANGQPKVFSSKKVAELLGLGREQNAVCDAVSAFRTKLINLLAENGVEGADDSVIIRGNSGYQIHPSLIVDDQSHNRPGKPRRKRENPQQTARTGSWKS